VGVASGVEASLAGRAGIPFQAIASGQLRGVAPWVAARNAVRVAQGARQAGRVLAGFRPDAVFVTGGFVAGPVVWAAWRAGVPVLIYLPDMEPGLAIRRLSRFARKVAVSFPEVAAYFPDKAVVTGYPVRQEILLAGADKANARRQLGLDDDEPVLLVFGGSHGARSINQALSAALPDLLPRCQVVHVTGTLDWPEAQKRVQHLPEALAGRYHPYAYLHEEMAPALAAADLAVTRAGASTLGEFPALGLPSILVPYPYSGQHQEVNADFMVGQGAAIKLADGDLTSRLLPTVLGLLDDRSVLAAMQAAASGLARPRAAQAIAEEIRQLARTANGS
jgi:UDP-N-acetylglucosamine--N-acetylmuramyl-(pentapeptide) pyrophosphoryl-undecaprenol N-acetylglucosamine transferase